MQRQRDVGRFGGIRGGAGNALTFVAKMIKSSARHLPQPRSPPSENCPRAPLDEGPHERHPQTASRLAGPFPAADQRDFSPSLLSGSRRQCRGPGVHPGRRHLRDGGAPGRGGGVARLLARGYLAQHLLQRADGGRNQEAGLPVPGRGGPLPGTQFRSLPAHRGDSAGIRHERCDGQLRQGGAVGRPAPPGRRGSRGAGRSAWCG